MTEKRDLTPKQETFCQEYLKDLNGTQAAIRAGYSEKTAQEQSSELLSKPMVLQRVNELKAERSARIQVSADDVLKELIRIAYADPRSVMSWGPDGVLLQDSSLLTDDAAALVSEVSETKSNAGSSVKIKLHDKLSALDKLGRHLKLFTDKIETTGKDGGPIQVNTSLTESDRELIMRYASNNTGTTRTD
jgi:phage terminase small subunit